MFAGLLMALVPACAHTPHDTTATAGPEIHNGSWVATMVDRSPNYCASCHSPASCGACHTDVVAHEEHTVDASGTAAYPPVTYSQAIGTTPGADPDRNE